jgi:hypothetical protein
MVFLVVLDVRELWCLVVDGRVLVLMQCGMSSQDVLVSCELETPSPSRLPRDYVNLHVIALTPHSDASLSSL